MRKVIIDTFFQGQGIGSALIKDCLEYAKEHNVRKIFLWVLEKNYNARKVYEKFGFKADDVTKFEDGTTELLLRYKLEM
ncbi:GNAT family N-acetyltransferase [Clostridium sp. BL-8]|uniref:GNAT family N-acetyltransferase n=1 Tax=Clostridium sp. BL-8 TaxID=349938 RepID=UPI00098BE80F